MDFETTSEQQEFRDRARRAAGELTGPGAEAGAAPAEIVRRLGALQMMGVPLPTEDGGTGKGLVEYVLALMEITRASPSAGAAMFVNNSLYCQPLLDLGKTEQRARYLRPCAAGEGSGSVALSHPLLDPDQVAMTSAPSGGGWRLSGRQEVFAAAVFPTHCVLAAGEGEVRRISLFVLDVRNTPGLRLEPGDGPDGGENALLVSEDAALPEDSLLGERGEGLAWLMKGRPKNWIGASAQGVGIGRAFLDGAVEYSLAGKRLGRPLFSSQSVQWVLADVAVALDAAELLTLKAAWLADHSKPFEKEAAMAKLFASDAAMKGAVDASQVLGEDGFSRRSPYWDLMRRAKRCQIEQESNLRIKGVITGHLVRDLKGRP